MGVRRGDAGCWLICCNNAHAQSSEGSSVGIMNGKWLFLFGKCGSGLFRVFDLFGELGGLGFGGV